MTDQKILIAAPTHKSKAYCQRDWIEQLSLLRYKNFQVYLSDNSPDESFCEWINSYGIECDHINPQGKAKFQPLAESHEQCRLKALEIGADYLLHWEVDMFTNDFSVIQKLLFREKVVVGVLYHIGFGFNSNLCLIQRRSFCAIEPATTLLLRNGYDANFVDGQCKQIAHCGLGCTLIHRSVLEKITFRHDAKQTVFPDSIFAEDCHHNRIPIFVDTAIVFEHRNKTRVA